MQPQPKPKSPKLNERWANKAAMKKRRSFRQLMMAALSHNDTAPQFQGVSGRVYRGYAFGGVTVENPLRAAFISIVEWCAPLVMRAASGVARGWESCDVEACQGEGFWFSGDEIEGDVPRVRF